MSLKTLTRTVRTSSSLPQRLTAAAILCVECEILENSCSFSGETIYDIAILHSGESLILSITITNKHISDIYIFLIKLPRKVQQAHDIRVSLADFFSSPHVTHRQLFRAFIAGRKDICR